jgi:hypothetical protein
LADGAGIADIRPIGALNGRRPPEAQKKPGDGGIFFTVIAADIREGRMSERIDIVLDKCKIYFRQL